MFNTYILDIIDTIKYDIFLMQKPIKDMSLINSIPRELNVKVAKGEHGYTLIFPDLPGMILYSEKVNSEDVLDIINDGLSVYFDIPRYYAKGLTFITKFKDAKGKVLASLPIGDDQHLKAYK
jgi:hypothetical protein